MEDASTRRMYRRVMGNYPGCCVTNSALQLSIVRDLSLNGFHVSGLSGIRRDSLVMLRLWLPGQEAAVDIDQAVVRWVDGLEFGAQIVSLSNEADFRLALHVEQALLRKIAA